MATLDDQRRAAGLNPLPKHTPESPTPPTRFDPEVEDATIGNEDRLRGIPVVGRVGGTMRGTRPGDPVSGLEAEARELHDHARLIVRGHLKRTRRRDHHDDRIEP